jgi:histidyl-tRNA synthetase
MAALEALGFDSLAVKLNSVGCAECRKPYGGVLKDELIRLRGRLCEDCVERADKNPMRIFDCKKCEDVKGELPSISDYLCPACAEHFARVKGHLDLLDRRYDVDPRLVRGLDYYTRTTFEILHGSLGAQNALCGGGLYDDLVEQCGGPPTPAVGFSAGLERIIAALPVGSPARRAGRTPPDFYVACADEGAAPRAVVAARALRARGRVEVDASMRALKTQLRQAERTGARIAVIVESASPSVLKWRDMATREQIDVEDGRLPEAAKAWFDVERARLLDAAKASTDAENGRIPRSADDRSRGGDRRKRTTEADEE